MKIRIIYINWKQFENAVYRSLSGVISKNYKKTNPFISYILSKSIVAKIKENHLIGVDNLITIEFDFEIELGEIKGISNFKFREYAPTTLRPFEYKKISIDYEKIDEFVKFIEGDKNDKE